jgi:hypothetical protein
MDVNNWNNDSWLYKSNSNEPFDFNSEDFGDLPE